MTDGSHKAHIVFLDMEKEFMKTIGLALSALGTSMLLVSCGGPQDPKFEMNQAEMGPNLKGPRQGVYLRASFDDDPSHFIGRFISNELSNDEIDENRGVQTQCSSFVTYKEVGSTGNFDEYYNSSTEVTANLGIEPTSAVEGGPEGSGNFGHESGTSLRVKYQLKKKLVAHVEDPVGFQACCDSAPGNCTNRFVGEFWYGDGEIYEKTGRATGGDASANIPGKGSGGLEVADGWAWRRGTNFTDMYFAFRVVDRVSMDDCGWVNQLPKSDSGQYFVGVSPPSPTEDIARTAAMRHARTQVVQFLGETIVSATSNTSSVVEGYVNSTNVVNTVAEGIANFVKDDRYCAAETQETPKGTMYVSRVLAFFPQDKAQEAKEATVDAVEKELEADGKLTPEVKTELEKARRGQ